MSTPRPVHQHLQHCNDANSDSKKPACYPVTERLKFHFVPYKQWMSDSGNQSQNEFSVSIWKKTWTKREKKGTLGHLQGNYNATCLLTCLQWLQRHQPRAAVQCRTGNKYAVLEIFLMFDLKIILLLAAKHLRTELRQELQSVIHSSGLLSRNNNGFRTGYTAQIHSVKAY